ncbi:MULTISPECIES: TetR/AcrR family transcriptional regulator C-terminal domain-containing protein [Kribbella]|nr:MULTISPECIES: TetR/AcrR family transcriptional regulator C-terminal domain-containing protein [Kribbella]
MLALYEGGGFSLLEADQAAQDYPRMKELYAAHRGHDIVGGSEDDFKYGLARILDGLQARRER